MNSLPRPRRRTFPQRVLGFFAFVTRFLHALVLANLRLARTILFEKRETLAPGFLVYPVEGLSKLEILVLSHCITLTPGTTTVEVSSDFTQLVLHALDARNPEKTMQEIRTGLEAPLLRWSR